LIPSPEFEATGTPEVGSGFRKNELVEYAINGDAGAALAGMMRTSATVTTAMRAALSPRTGPGMKKLLQMVMNCE